MQQSAPRPSFPPHKLLIRARDEVNSAEVVKSKESREMSGPKGSARIFCLPVLPANARLQLPRQDIELRVHSTAGGSDGLQGDTETSCPTDSWHIDIWIGDLPTGWNVQWCFHCWIL